MSRNLNRITLIALAAFSFASCKKEEAPLTPQTDATRAAAMSPGLINGAKQYSLIRRGNDSLFYYNDGRLAKVKHGFTYTVYNYGFTTITAKTYSSNFLEEEVTYTIDPVNMKALEAQWTGYTYSPNGYITTKKSFGFTYYDDGKLKTKYNKNNVADRQKFNYFDDGNLKNVLTYNSNNEYTSGFYYDYENNNLPPIFDKLKLNPDYQGLDLYLKIFGTFTKHLPVQIVDISANGTFYRNDLVSYTLNADGYITQSVSKSLMTNNSKTMIYGYRTSL